MSSQFDEKLIQKVRTVFDNYEDSGADYGWLELRKKYPAQNRRKPAVFYWIGSAAAVLLLALGVWALSRQAPEETVTTAENKISLPKEHPAISKSEDGKQSFAAAADHTAEKTAVQAAGQNQEADKKNKEQALAVSSSSKLQNKISGEKNILAGGEPKAENPEFNTLASSEPLDAAAGSEPAARTPVPASENIADNPAPTSAEPAKILSSLTDIALEPSEKSADEKANKKLSFSVYAGSFISYAEGSSNKVNLGAGFSSNIALTKNLRLSAGLALSQNDLSFKNDIPLGVQNSFKSAFNRTDAVSSLKAITYDLKGYDASLLGLDIPVNLTYVLSEKKNELYISAGVSSGTFINESYTYYYSGYGPSNSRLPTEAPVTNKDEVQSDMSSFDFARMLNLSFGMGYPVGKQNKLIIEPFLKYPLKGAGEEDLRFGAGGVNLKFNFKNGK